jgi:hypothetical protein
VEDLSFVVGKVGCVMGREPEGRPQISAGLTQGAFLHDKHNCEMRRSCPAAAFLKLTAKFTVTLRPAGPDPWKLLLDRSSVAVLVSSWPVLPG